MSVDTFTVAASGDDGDVTGTHRTYPPPVGMVVTTAGSTVSIERSVGYRLSVALLRFDTSALPSDAVITGAVLKITPSVITAQDASATIVAEWYDPANWPISLADYTPLVDNLCHQGSLFTELQTGMANSLTLVNLSNISLTGYTGIRVHAYLPSAPTGTNRLTFASEDSGSGTAQLVVTYTTVTAYSATFAGGDTPGGTFAGSIVLVGQVQGGGDTPTGSFSGAVIPASTQTAGVTDDVVLGEHTFRVEPGSLTRSDVTAALPRVAVATDSKKRSDFSELDTLGQFTWHHGRGQFLYADVASFMEGEFVDTRVQGQVIPAPARHLDGEFAATAQIVDLLYWPATAKVYALCRDGTDSHLYERDLDATLWSEVAGAESGLQAAGSVPTTMAVFSVPVAGGRTTTDYLVISRNRPGDAVTGLDYLYTTDGTTFSTGPAATSLAGQVRVWRERLVYDISNNGLILRADPSATTDDITITNVGSGAEAITNLIPLGEDLIVLKEGAAFAIEPQLDGSYVTKQVLDYSWGRDPDNGKGAYVKDGTLYFNVMQSVYQFTGTTVRGVGPDLGAHEPALAIADAAGVIQVPISDPTGHGPGEAKRGPVIGMSGNGGWLFGAVEGSATRTILAYGGTGWHELTQLQTGAAGRLWFLPTLADTGTFSSPTLWYRDGTTLVYLRLSEGTDNRWDYAAADYETTSTPLLISSWFHADLPEVMKDWQELYLDMDVRDDTTLLTVEFQADFDDTWYTLGTSYGREPLRFPDNSIHPSALRARAIRLRFSWTNTSSVAPRLKGFYFRFISRPIARYGWNLQVLAENALQRVDGSIDSSTSEQLAQRLYSLRERSGPIRFDDGRALAGLHNYLKNPGLEGWYSGLPVNWDLVGAPVVSKDAQWKESGGYAARVETDVAGQGLVSGSSESLAAGTYHAVARIRVSVGTVVMELLKDGVRVTSTVITPAYLTDQWAGLGLPAFTRTALDYTADSSGTYQLRVTGGTGSDIFWVDGCELREGADDGSPYIAEGEPRCKPTTPGTFFATTAYRPGFWLVYVATITEAFYNPRQRLSGGSPELHYGTRFAVALREAF